MHYNIGIIQHWCTLTVTSVLNNTCIMIEYIITQNTSFPTTNDVRLGQVLLYRKYRPYQISHGFYQTGLSTGRELGRFTSLSLE